MKKFSFFLLSLVIAFVCSCSKTETEVPQHEEPQQPQPAIADTFFATDAGASASINSYYTAMVQRPAFTSGSSQSLSLLCGLYADELTNHSSLSDQADFYNVSLTADNKLVEESVWNSAYAFIDSANKMIEKLGNSPNVSANLKQRLTGEAKFIRAFCHLHLTNLFGGIPYITSTDSALVYGSVSLHPTEVYEKIITDLSAASELLPPDYQLTNNERTRPNKWAAKALLARAHLYVGNYGAAEIEATSVINNAELFELVPLNDVFLKNSREAIWQLQPVAQDLNTYEGYEFILNDVPSNVSLGPQLLNGFDHLDSRKTAWTASFESGGNLYYYPAKYKVKTGTLVTEYSMVLRLAEQYLIRAEARAQQENLQAAIWDIDAIRTRAGLPGTEGQSRDEILEAIFKERQFELFTEWGHRFVDLKRTGKANQVLADVKGFYWSQNDNLFPVPFSALNNNPNLLQNPGYW